ncbi:MAG: hypothetical protein H6818_05570 [Phycisphaerales bacterium]|nr:hypothetical protein [Phycisphaerales bacterium]
MLRFRHILTSLALVSLIAIQAEASPNLGDKAPALGITGWVGEKPASVPGDENAKDHVFVVTIWAGWHNRSLSILPTMHQLQTDNADKGLIVVMVSAEDADEIQSHMKTDKAKSAFFAVDGDAVATDTWADDNDAFPISYVIGKDNLVAWKGDPSRHPGEIEQVVRKLFDGSFDLNAAKNEEDNDRKYEELTQQLQTAYGLGKEDEAFKIVDKMIATKPKELHPYFIKRQMIQQFNAYTRLPAHLSAMERVFKDSASDLARILEVELTFEVGDRNPAFMLRCADRLQTLTNGRDPNALVAIAAIWAELGMHAEAVELLEKVVVLLPPGEERRPVEMRLAYYKAIERLREQRSKQTKEPTSTPSADTSASE